MNPRVWMPFWLTYAGRITVNASYWPTRCGSAFRESCWPNHRPGQSMCSGSPSGLQRRYCFSAEAAHWAIDSWCEGLNVAPPDQIASRNGTDTDSRVSLSDFPQSVLYRLLTDYGPALLNDPSRADALLADFCSPHPTERFLLVYSLQEHIPVETVGATAERHRS